MTIIHELILYQSRKVDNAISCHHYLSKLEETIRQAYTIGASWLKERKAKFKNRLDKGACLRPFQVGERLVKKEILLEKWHLQDSGLQRRR